MFKTLNYDRVTVTCDADNGWEKTEGATEAFASCSNDETGHRSRLCNATAHWEEVKDLCLPKNPDDFLLFVVGTNIDDGGSTTGGGGDGGSGTGNTGANTTGGGGGGGNTGGGSAFDKYKNDPTACELVLEALEKKLPFTSDDDAESFSKLLYNVVGQCPIPQLENSDEEVEQRLYKASFIQPAYFVTSTYSTNRVNYRFSFLLLLDIW